MLSRHVTQRQYCVTRHCAVTSRYTASILCDSALCFQCLQLLMGNPSLHNLMRLICHILHLVSRAINVGLLSEYVTHGVHSNTGNPVYNRDTVKINYVGIKYQ